MNAKRIRLLRAASSGAVAALGFALAQLAAAQAVPGDVERQLLQRQQYQDELLLRQRQYQERLDPSLGPAQRQELERRQFDQSRQQRQLHDTQIQRHLQMQQRLPQLPEAQQTEQLLFEQQRFTREREAFDPPAAFDP